MSKNGKNSNILIGVKAICTFLENMSEPTFYKWVERGLPIRMVDGRIYAHKQNIDEFFKVVTCHNERGVIEKPENNGMEGA